MAQLTRVEAMSGWEVCVAPPKNLRDTPFRSCRCQDAPELDPLWRRHCIAAGYAQSSATVPAIGWRAHYREAFRRKEAKLAALAAKAPDQNRTPMSS